MQGNQWLGRYLSAHITHDEESMTPMGTGVSHVWTAAFSHSFTFIFFQESFHLFMKVYWENGDLSRAKLAPFLGNWPALAKQLPLPPFPPGLSSSVCGSGYWRPKKCSPDFFMIKFPPQLAEKPDACQGLKETGSQLRSLNMSSWIKPSDKIRLLHMQGKQRRREDGFWYYNFLKTWLRHGTNAPFKRLDSTNPNNKWNSIMGKLR